MISTTAQKLKNVPKEFKENILSLKLNEKDMTSRTMNTMFEKMRVADLKTKLGQVNGIFKDYTFSR